MRLDIFSKHNHTMFLLNACFCLLALCLSFLCHAQGIENVNQYSSAEAEYRAMNGGDFPAEYLNLANSLPVPHGQLRDIGYPGGKLFFWVSGGENAIKLYNAINSGNQSSTNNSQVPSGSNYSGDMSQMVTQMFLGQVMVPVTNAIGAMITDLFMPRQEDPEQKRREQELLEAQRKQREEEWRLNKQSVANSLKDYHTLTNELGIGYIPAKDLKLKKIPEISVWQGEKAWDQLNAAEWLSRMAVAAADDNNFDEASFLSEQAFQAATGAPIAVRVPPIPKPDGIINPTPEQMEVYKGFTDAINIQTKKLVKLYDDLDNAIEKKDLKDKEVVTKQKEVDDIKKIVPKDQLEEQNKKSQLDRAIAALEESKINQQAAQAEVVKYQGSKEQEEKILNGIQDMYKNAKNDANYADELLTNFQ